MRHPVVSSCARSTIALLLLLTASSPAFAQAWLPAKGEGTVSVLASNTLSKDHFLPDERYDFGHIDANTVLFDVTYGLTDRMAVTVGLPIVMSRYRGAFPHRPITLDDGNWHTTSQDFRFNVRYNVMRGPLVITPFIGSELPTREYDFFAHAAPGRQLKELAGGVSVGRLFAELGLVLQGRYGLNISEGALDQPRRYSQLSLEAAYFLTPVIRVLAMTGGRIGHTGIDLFPDSGRVLPLEVFQRHDQLSKESALNVGGGAAFTLSETVDAFASFTTTVTGRNTHAVNRGISVGMSWSFGRSADDERLIARDGRQGSLIRCLCEKAGE
jgi:hypothetical protein